MLSDSTVTTLVRLLVVGLLAITVVSAYVLSIDDGFQGAVPALLGLYITIVLAIGVFTERMFDARVQAAFAVGFVAWSVYIYLDQSAILGAVLSITGLFYLGTETHGLLSAR